jgi:hypothetical protein
MARTNPGSVVASLLRHSTVSLTATALPPLRFERLEGDLGTYKRLAMQSQGKQ